MPNDPLAESALAVLRSRLRAGVRATPLCLAVMGWLADVPVGPDVAEARLCADGKVWLRLSDERRLEPLCSFLEFLDQVRTVCVALAMDEPQTAWVVGWARRRLG